MPPKATYKIHSGAIGDGIAARMAAGAVDNNHEESEAGVTVDTNPAGAKRQRRPRAALPTSSSHLSTY